MKKKSIFIVLLLIVASGLISCFKSTDNNRVIIEPPTSSMLFRIIDKSTNEDLFLSSNPKLALKDVKVSAVSIANVNTGATRADSLSLFIDSSRNCLILPFGWSFFPKIYLHFSDNRTDSLLIKSFAHNHADSVYFNNALYLSDSTGILTFRQ